MIEKINKIGSAIKSGTKRVGHVMASGARRAWSRFKRLPAVIPSDTVINFVLKQWIKNSQQVATVKSLTEIFRRGGPCDIMVLKTCIGSIKAKHSSSMVTEKKHFDIFNNTQLYGENGNVTIVRTKCNEVLNAITNKKNPKQALEDLTRAFKVLTQETWRIGSSGVTNPFCENLVSVKKFIENLCNGRYE